MGPTSLVSENAKQYQLDVIVISQSAFFCTCEATLVSIVLLKQTPHVCITRKEMRVSSYHAGNFGYAAHFPTRRNTHADTHSDYIEKITANTKRGTL
jgi:hypothetical protein